MNEEVFVHRGFAYLATVDDGDFDGERMVHSFAHRAVTPEGRVQKIPFNPGFEAMNRPDFEGWVKIGCPVEAKPLVQTDYFTDGDLEWLAAIAEAHKVPPGDTTCLAVLARLYGNNSPVVTV